MGKVVLVLVTPSPPDLKTENGQRKVATWLTGKKISFREVDAIDQVDVRKELCGISGINGNYPQVFISDGASETTYVGGYDEIESLIELNDLDPELLAKNPDLKNFDMVFAECKAE